MRTAGLRRAHSISEGRPESNQKTAFTFDAIKIAGHHSESSCTDSFSVFDRDVGGEACELLASQLEKPVVIVYRFFECTVKPSMVVTIDVIIDTQEDKDI